MDLSYAAGRIGGSMTGVLSAGNEQAVEVLLNMAFFCGNLACFVGGSMPGVLGAGDEQAVGVMRQEGCCSCRERHHV